jgi:hypothetical protein
MVSAYRRSWRLTNWAAKQNKGSSIGKSHTFTSAFPATGVPHSGQTPLVLPVRE